MLDVRFWKASQDARLVDSSPPHVVWSYLLALALLPSLWLKTVRGARRWLWCHRSQISPFFCFLVEAEWARPGNRNSSAPHPWSPCLTNHWSPLTPETWEMALSGEPCFGAPESVAATVSLGLTAPSWPAFFPTHCVCFGSLDILSVFPSIQRLGLHTFFFFSCVPRPSHLMGSVEDRQWQLGCRIF